MRFGIADYGMGVWEGGTFDWEHRLAELKEIGYDGIERLSACSADDVIHQAGRARRLGCDFATVRGPDIEHSIQWTAAVGKQYVWVQVRGKDMDTYCRQVNVQAETCERWGIHVACHNHLGATVESQPELEEFLDRCPKARVILDTAHLAAADGDPIEIVRKYPDRLQVIHLKDWLVTDESVGLENWPNRGRFCELGAGNIGLDNAAVMKALVEIGYDGWVFVEHDTHLQDPLNDLAISRQYLRDAGF